MVSDALARNKRERKHRAESVQGVSRLSRECASILETRLKGAPGRDKPVPYDSLFLARNAPEGRASAARPRGGNFHGTNAPFVAWLSAVPRRRRIRAANSRGDREAVASPTCAVDRSEQRPRLSVARFRGPTPRRLHPSRTRRRTRRRRCRLRIGGLRQPRGPVRAGASRTVDRERSRPSVDPRIGSPATAWRRHARWWLRRRLAASDAG